MEDPTSRGMRPESPLGDERRNVWVDRWQRGIDQEESFRQIFCHYYPTIRAFFIRRSKSEEEVEDLVQETFLRVHRNLANFRGDSQFETWLFQVSANVYKNAVRSQTTQKRDAQEVSWNDIGTDSAKIEETAIYRDALENDPLDELLQDERSRLLQEALQELPSQMRRCVELRISWDMKYREIAVLMGLSIETVKSQLHQARQLLKEKMGS
jgi:RNA polymerase sigma-70 factor (ECF subfamily)